MDRGQRLQKTWRGGSKIERRREVLGDYRGISEEKEEREQREDR